MCKKAKCAYLKKDNFCLMHKCVCDVLHPEARCKDGVARADHKKHERFWECVKDWNLNTARGRFAFSTRKARGHKVYRTCSRKRRYADLYAAKKSAIELYRKKGRELFAYECPFCGGYHLTHQKRRHLEMLNGCFNTNEEIAIKKYA